MNRNLSIPALLLAALCTHAVLATAGPAILEGPTPTKSELAELDQGPRTAVTANLDCSEPIDIGCFSNVTHSGYTGAGNVSTYSCLTLDYSEADETVYELTSGGDWYLITLTYEYTLGVNDLDLFVLTECDEGTCIAYSILETGTEEIMCYLQEGRYYVVVDGWVGQRDGTPFTVTTSCDFESCDAGGPYSGSTGETISFNGAGAAGAQILGYEWDFGDGSTGTGATPTHVYEQPGTYEVELTVQYQTCDGTFSYGCSTGAVIGGTSSSITVTSPNGGETWIVGDERAVTWDWEGVIETVAIYLSTDGGSTFPITLVENTENFGVASVIVPATPTGQARIEIVSTDPPGYGDVSDANFTIMQTQNQPPVCMHGGPYSGNAGQSISFDGTGSSDPDGSIISYEWEFGDGESGQGANPTHIYAAANTYLVTLTVIDNGEASSNCATSAFIGQLNLPPVCDAGGPYAGSVDQSITFDGTASTDPDGDPLTYEWDFGDDSTGSGPNPAHAYAAAGTYNVTLTVADTLQAARSCETAAVIVSTNLPPVCDAGGPYAAVVDQSITFDGTGSTDPDGSIVSYAWDFGDGSTGTGAGPLHAYTEPGTYTVILVVTDDDGATSSCQAQATVSSVNLPPVCDAGGPHAALVFASITFDGTGSTDPDGSIVSYDWDFGDGSTDSGPDPLHAYAEPGTYTVTLVVTDDDGATSSCQTQASITQEPNDPPGCDAGGPYLAGIDEPITFDGTGSSDPDGSIVAYTWDFGDERPGSGPNPIHAYIEPGTYTVTLTLTDDDGATSSCNIAAIISDDNRAPLCDAGGPYLARTFASITFDGTGSSDPDGSIIAYQWDFGDGSGGTGSNPTHTYLEAGEYTVTLEVTDNEGEDSSCTTTASIGNQPPLCDAGGPYSGDKNEPITFNGSASSDPDGSIVTYIWNFGDGTNGSGPTPTHIYTSSGEFTLSLTVIDNDNGSSTCPTSASIAASPIDSVMVIDEGIQNFVWRVVGDPELEQLRGFHRQGGETGYTSTSVFLRDVLDNTRYSIAFPSDQLTARGVEYYLTFFVDGEPGSLGDRAVPQRMPVAVAGEPAPALEPRIYRMVAAPIVVDGRENTLELLRPFLGETGAFSWMMGTWEPLRRLYRVISPSEPAGFEPGQAYWLISATDTDWSLPGSSNFPPDGRQMFEITLERGWNMVGNPAAYPVTLDRTRLLIDDGATPAISFDQAVARGLVRRTFYFYAASGDSAMPYVLDPPRPEVPPVRRSLAVWEGCWMRNDTELPLTLLIPDEEEQEVPGKGFAASSLVGPTPTWLLAVEAAAQGERSRVELVMAPGAGDGLDLGDVYLPPPVPGRELRLALELSDREDALMRDARSSTSDRVEWRLEVSSPRGPVELRWSEPEGGESDGEAEVRSLTLVHEPDGERWNMTASRSIRLQSGRHSLRVIASTDGQGVPAAAPALRAMARPNPFRDRTALSFELPATGRASLQVYDVTGRRIWEQVFESVSAGEHEVIWPGIDQQGTPVPAGNYFLRLEFEPHSGSLTRHTEVTVQRMTFLR